ncbi:aldose epimerase family protein [Streptococcus catagoni]|uniref:aldose epimerase family protein n=1 Tax=Streptococcus catagoni TaxID=2654874 RepID=UPI001409F4AC|nr:aldose epimerase family protein [Streptococcus catagoni]
MKIVSKVIDGEEVSQISLINNQGVQARFLTLGATWQAYLVPQNDGSYKNLVLGHEKASDYLANNICAGQSIGRVAGRIGKGQVTLSGKTYQLPQNNFSNCLHGGPEGFHRQNWDFDSRQTDDFLELTFSYRAKEEVDGFPADMTVQAVYRLANDNSLSVTYRAFQANHDTLFNPTCHAYFNLSKEATLTSHSLYLAADERLETDEHLIPTGRFLPVEDTAYDFRIASPLQKRIEHIGGLDDAFLVKSSLEDPIATLTDNDSGDQVSIFSERNAIVVYSFNYPEEGVVFERSKERFNLKHEGLALEAQTLPDAINHENFGDTFLLKNQDLSYTIRYQFNLPSLFPKK